MVFSVYNYHVHGERGLQVLPHPNFWCETLPNVVRESTSRCVDWAQDCWAWSADRLRGISQRSSSGSQTEYEKIRDTRGGANEGIGSTTDNAAGTNFYDVENDADLDEDDHAMSAAPVAAPVSSSKPKTKAAKRGADV